MKIIIGSLAFGWMLLTSGSVHSEDFLGGVRQRVTSTTSQGHGNVIGTVSKVTENMLTVDTEEGTTRSYTVKTAAIDGVTKLQSGDRVLLEIDEGNQIIGINNIGEKHQLVHGEVVGIDRDKNIVTLDLKDGTSQSYGMKSAMAGKMNNILKGAIVTLMVDQRNNLAIDVHVD